MDMVNVAIGDLKCYRQLPLTLTDHVPFLLPFNSCK